MVCTRGNIDIPIPSDQYHHRSDVGKDATSTEALVRDPYTGGLRSKATLPLVPDPLIGRTNVPLRPIEPTILSNGRCHFEAVRPGSPSQLWSTAGHIHVTGPDLDSIPVDDCPRV